MSAIDDKYAALGGAGGFLGQPTSPEQDCPDHRGRFRHFQNGSIYWSPESGAHEVHGLIRAKWARLDWEKSSLGYPVTDETSAPESSGRYNHFQYGSIYWKSGAAEAFEVHGAIRDKWASLGWERSPLGYPISDEGTTEFTLAVPPGQPPPPPTPPGRPGRHSNFEHGSVYWSPQTGAYAVGFGIPQQHRSSEAQVGRGDCYVNISFAGFGIDSEELGRVFPAWVPVESYSPVILEGEVVERDGPYPGPDVSFEDFPTNHYTHDFNFAVRPDPTPDSRYTNLLRIQADSSEKRQELIEIEWETGLAASNDGNLLQDPNTRGDSGGFFSSGHGRREVIWNWPTLGDRVHIEGLWIWDRGHPPAETEIHPPRLVAIQRHLPVMTRRQVDPSGIEPSAPVLATRVDIFATGDGGALWNNRTSSPSFAAPVFMNDRDYEFRISHMLPRPSPNAQLKWIVEKHPGDTYPLEQIVAPITVALPPGAEPVSANVASIGVRPNIMIAVPLGAGPPAPAGFAVVHLPWHSRQIPNTAVLARTVYLYWDEGIGVSAEYRPRVFQVTLDDVFVHKSQDIGDGEYRLFVEVGGNWLFVNELPGDDDILNDGLGDTGDDETWWIHRQFTLYVPPDGSFRVHACGWEADGVNDVFGRLVDPNHPCDAGLKDWLNGNLFTSSVFTNGAKDDPIGQVNSLFNSANGFGVGRHEDRSTGELAHDAWGEQDTDPNDSYRLHYLIEELPWPSV